MKPNIFNNFYNILKKYVININFMRKNSMKFS